MVTIIDLLPSGVVAKPLFESEEAYQKFRDEFTAEVAPAMKEHDRRRALSEKAALTRGPFR